MKTYIYEEHEKLEETIEIECRKKQYDIIVDYRTYCSHPNGDCMYKDKLKDKTGYYRCMMLEKMVR
jgi:hypothetical protein